MTEQDGRRAPGVEALTDKIKQLVHEGNTRRVVVRNGKGEPVLDIPVTAGVVAAVAAPMVTAVAAFAALAGPWSLNVERTEDAAPVDDEPQDTAAAGDEPEDVVPADDEPQDSTPTGDEPQDTPPAQGKPQGTPPAGTAPTEG
ncbi:DUF4342 domain-containing protein [Saccharothrix sp. ALI-22-I]|uniref:DUF4342 domain-containing protein n=1 Tax=Saccharothrix sp. ALI-22-I TaxID=1933778 RepID=UPI00097C1B9D|nr:DUF4342 domain-containing protein [Saccharothrix sp. ALI-22-I]